MKTPALTKSLYFTFLILLWAACSPVPKRQPEVDKPFIINDSGDTLLTGVPLPADGRQVSPDSFPKPQVFLLTAPTKVIPIPSEVYQAKTPKVVEIPKDLTVITPSENGVPLPKEVPAIGKVVPALQPKPTPAPALQFKDNATLSLQYLDIDKGRGSNAATLALEDSRGNLWFRSSAGAIRFDGKRFVLFTEKEGLSSKQILNIIEDRQGNIWFGTFHGVSLYDGKTFTQFTQEDGLSHNLVHCMLEDRQGNIWFGTHKGLTSYDGKNFKIYTEKEGLSSNKIYTMMEDSKGFLWFGTAPGNKLPTGVNRFDGKHFTHFETKEGLSGSYVTSMMEDRQGGFGLGLFIMACAAMTAILLHNIPQRRVWNI